MIQTIRIENWHQNLTALINERKEQPFAWGTNDCSLWAADCIVAVTGVDFALNARGTYDTAIGAYKCIQSVYEVDNVKQIFEKLFGETVPQFYARQGDIVYQDSNYEGFNAAVGVCNGEFSFFLHDPEDEEQGLFKIPTLSLDGCFRIG